MICPGLHIHIFFTLVIYSLAEKHDGHLHRPDTAPETDLVPAVRIAPPETTTWRSTSQYRQHHHHHHDHSFLPTLPVPQIDRTRDYDDYTDDYGDHTRDYHGESGDYGGTAVQTEAKLDDENEDYSNDQLKSSAADSRSSLILVSVAATAMSVALMML